MGVGEFGQIWDRAGQVWMGKTDLAQMCDIASG